MSMLNWKNAFPADCSVGENVAPRRARRRAAARRRGMSRGRMLFSGVVVSALALGGYAFLSRPAVKRVERPLTQLVSLAPFENVVVEQGEIESSKNEEIRCEVKARGTSGITIIEVVPEGAMVEQGDILVRLDSTALDQEQIQQQIACNTAEATAIQSQNTFEAAKIAKIEYLEGTFVQEEQLVLSEVFVAEQALRTAQLAFASSERLSLRGMVTALQLEGEQFAVDKARKDLEAANTKLTVLRKYTREKMVKQLDSDIASTEAKWKADQKGFELETAKLRDIEDQVAKCTIRAPRAGQVKYANKYSGRGGAEFVVEPGAVVREQQPIIQLPDSTLMQVKATISEARINAIRTGMPAAIRVDALQDEVLQGEVMKVNQYAEPGGWMSGNVKKYATFIRVMNPPENLRAGMNAEVRVFIERQPEALQVPVQAIAETKGKYFCLVENAEGDLETRPIECGSSNDKFMVVTGGLQKGERVVLNPRSREELELPDLPDPVSVVETVAPPATQLVAAQTPGGPRGGPAGAGGGPGGAGPAGPGGGRPGGGFTPAAMVERTLAEYDANHDGKLQATEIQQMPAERGGRLAEADTNKDGDVDRAELTAASAKFVQMMRQQAAGGGDAAAGAGL
jgi:HlyD family secretion protein